MKTLTFFMFVFASSATTFANNSFEQLCAFNPYWKNYEDRLVAQQAISFNSEAEYIQEHLKNVIEILRSNSTSLLSAEELQVRNHSISLLADYRSLGIFPINYFRKERIPVFIDENGTHCAVGFLMQQTGFEDLAQRISLANNYAWVREIQDAELGTWQSQSGFTVDELKLIQGAYEFYMPDALILPNRYEVPQKPACDLRYFEDEATKEPLAKTENNIWIKGEGKDGVLNGKWIQNFAPGVPWIIGFYSNGNRTGKWAEYYQGTTLLCRTEHWKDDKLNGVRTRFDRDGKVIEEIYFNDGKAVTKINYELEQSLIWVRTPIDSTLMETQLFSSSGNLIAKGKEEVYNPDNLLWFQNIELTALNTAAITSRSVSVQDGRFGLKREFGGESSALYNQPALVEYRKIGIWNYYTQNNSEFSHFKSKMDGRTLSHFSTQYPHLAIQLAQKSSILAYFDNNKTYDSIHVKYEDNHEREIQGFSSTDYLRLSINFFKDKEQEILRFNPYQEQGFNPYQSQAYRSYYPDPVNLVISRVKSIGRLTKDGKKIGVWNYYDRHQVLRKTENFIVPEEMSFELEE